MRYPVAVRSGSVFSRIGSLFLVLAAIVSPSLAQEPPTEGGPVEQPVERAEEDPQPREDGKEKPPGEDRVEGRSEDGAPFTLDSIEPEPIRLKWNRFVEAMRGLTRYSLFDGKMRFRLGGRFQVDGTAGNADEALTAKYGDVESRFDFRRGRIFAEGRVRNMDFRIEFDFFADSGFKDAYLEGTEGGLAIWGHHLGKLRYGHFKEPFSLERQMSGFHLGFLEWSLPVSTFAPGRNVGFMVHDKAKSGRFSWAFGVFSFGKRADDNASTSTFSLTTRWTGLPIYSDDGRTLLHLGASFSSRNPSSDTVQYRSRPEARFAPYLTDTGEFDARGNQLLGFEVAGLRGPVWFQGEYIEAMTDSELLGDPSFSGF
jgi:phosphate-selective porin OprO/OprP